MGSGSVGAPGQLRQPERAPPGRDDKPQTAVKDASSGDEILGQGADHSGAERYEKGGDVVEFTVVDQKDSRPGPHDVPRSRTRRAARPPSIGRIGRTL